MLEPVELTVPLDPRSVGDPPTQQRGVEHQVYLIPAGEMPVNWNSIAVYGVVGIETLTGRAVCIDRGTVRITQ
jgi:hypothetical protein